MPARYYAKQLVLTLFASAAVTTGTAQISEYGDCSEVYHDQSKFERPLTQEEKSARLENTFYERLSSTTKCVDSSSDSSNGASGASGASAGGMAGIAAGNSLSSNVLGEGERSVAITSSVVQKPSSKSMPSNSPVGEGSGNGRAHLDLEAVDNKAILMAQIKAQADLESDLAIKEKLMEQYEALK
jgi:hypothetical protein